MSRCNSLPFISFLKKLQIQKIEKPFKDETVKRNLLILNIQKDLENQPLYH